MSPMASLPRPEILYRSRLPRISELGPHPVLVFDRVLARGVPGFRAWKSGFPLSFEVRAGEQLKSLASFSRFVEDLVERTDRLPTGSMTIVAAGGGSVGDFTGFIASVFRRGVELIQLPSTWLSALDSSHGGKTALNVGGAKNQIGTFHPASRIYLIKPLLLAQPEERARDAFGELAKIALIDGRSWVKCLMALKAPPGDHGGRLIWKCLPDAVESKYRVVRRDPFERRRIRQALNLGHTFGHVLEAYHGLAHGEAVAQGLLFAVEWSARRGIMTARERDRIILWLGRGLGILPRSHELGAIPEREARRLLMKDKKRDTASSILFVFLARPGGIRLESVRLEEIVDEARGQGWVSGGGSPPRRGGG